jgi:hypothetical protein
VQVLFVTSQQWVTLFGRFSMLRTNPNYQCIHLPVVLNPQHQVDSQGHSRMKSSVDAAFGYKHSSLLFSLFIYSIALQQSQPFVFSPIGFFLFAPFFCFCFAAARSPLTPDLAPDETTLAPCH